MDDYSRVLAGDRIGIDLRGILPDDDGDGVWNGDDDCDAESGTSNTNPADYATVDEFGCADSQRDSDGDGRMDDVDDCREIYGTSFQPTVGALILMVMDGLTLEMHSGKMKPNGQTKMVILLEIILQETKPIPAPLFQAHR